MKTPAEGQNPGCQAVKFQRLSTEAKHAFRWSRGTATCSCGRWALWGAPALESAHRDHALHRLTRAMAEGEPVGKAPSHVDCEHME